MPCLVQGLTCMPSKPLSYSWGRHNRPGFDKVLEWLNIRRYLYTYIYDHIYIYYYYILYNYAYIDTYICFPTCSYLKSHVTRPHQLSGSFNMGKTHESSRWPSPIRGMEASMCLGSLVFWDALFRVVMEWQWIQRSELVLTFDFELGLKLWNEFPYTQDTRLWLAGIFRWCVWFYVGAEHGDLAWKVWECWFQFQCVGSVFHDSTCKTINFLTCLSYVQLLQHS